MPLDLTKAPPGMADYGEEIRNLTDAQLFERIAAWPDREIKDWGDAQLNESILWTLRCEIEELRRRLEAWLAESLAELPPFSGLQPKCPKCGEEGKGKVKISYHDEPEPDFSCWFRLEPGREHVHRLCKTCGYEWIEACEGKSEEKAKPGGAGDLGTMLNKAAELGAPSDFTEEK